MTGYFVGNGVFDGAQQADTVVPFAYGHGLMSTKMHAKITKACDSYIKPSKECKKLLDTIDGMEVDMNGYDAYRTCYHPKKTASPSARQAHQEQGQDQEAQEKPKSLKLGQLMDMSWRAHAGKKGAVIDWVRNLRESVPCINSVTGTSYLNKAAVKKALHVEQSPNTWAVCGGVNYHDDGVYTSMIAVHKQMLQYKPRVLVYNGDVDPGCNYLWAEASVEQFGLDVVQEWHPWTYDDKLVGQQLGGYATNYASNVTMATIHGAGHMSPQWRPEAAFAMFSRFLESARL